MQEKLELVLTLIGGLGVVLTVLGAVFPKEWKFTQVCAKFGADLKGVHTPAGKP
jgi:hypothetical protein